MNDTEITSAPAGVETEIAPPQSMSVEAAASLWTDAQEKAQPTPEPAQSNGQDTGQSNEAAAAEPNDTGAAPAPDDGGEPAPAGEPDTQPEDPEAVPLEKIDGRTRITLRDGTTLTGKQLKERIEDLIGLDRRRAEFETEAKSRVAQINSSAQHAQLLQQILPNAIKALEAQLPTVPPYPPAELMDSDFLAYQKQVDAHNRGLQARGAKEQELQQMRDMDARNQEQQTAQQRAEQATFLQTQQTELFRKMPDLRDPAKAKAFQAEVLESARLHGFTEQETGQVADHRVLLMAKHALAYLKLQANPPKPDKTTPAPAAGVAQPGRRVAPQEASAAKADELIAKARNGGRGVSVEELARLYSQANS